MLLWLWCRLANVALIRPLAWEPPYAKGTALKKAKKKVPRQIGFDFISQMGNGSHFPKVRQAFSVARY